MVRERGLKVSLFLGILFVLSHMTVVVKYAALNDNYSGGNMTLPFSSFMFFMGYDMYGGQGTIFYQMAPLLAAIPYANSYYVDISEGYVKNIISRKNKKEYLVAKYLAVFLSGGIAVTVPLILDIMMCTAFLPSYPPVEGTGVFAVTDSILYAAHPCLYIAGFLLIDFLLGGIYAVSVLLATNLVQNKYLLIIFPYLFMLVWKYAVSLAGQNCWPVTMAIPEQHTGSVISYVLVILGMFILTFSVHYIGGVKRDEF
jgi:hypothetical protein